MNPLKIRRARPRDAAALSALAAKAFWDAYREIDDPDDIADYVAKHFHVDVITGVLSDARCTVMLGEVGSTLAGYAIVRQGDTPPCVVGPDPIELWRFYLAKEFTGQGLGKQLMCAALIEARDRHAKTLWLGVYDRNVRAVAFYERQGFRKVGGHELIFGGKPYIDPVYAISLSEMVIRQADPGQADALSTLALAAKAHWGYAPEVIEAWRPQLTIRAEDVSSRPFFVGEVNEGLVGFYSLASGDAAWELDNMWIAPSFMHRGFGRQLFEHALEYAHRRGARLITIDADPNAEAFYRRCGAVRRGEVAAPIPGEPARVRPQFAFELPTSAQR